MIGAYFGFRILFGILVIAAIVAFAMVVLSAAAGLVIVGGIMLFLRWVAIMKFGEFGPDGRRRWWAVKWWQR